MPDENQRPFRLWTARKSAGNPDQTRRTGAVVIGAVIDSIRLSIWQDALGVPDVVIMCPECDVSTLQPAIRAFDDTNDISGVTSDDSLIIGIQVESQRDTLKRKPGQLILLFRFG